jgi:hypothetical protein
VQHERALAASAFPGDTGEAAPRTRRLQADFTATPTIDNYLAVVEAVCGDRVMVPVVATATDVGRTTAGLSSDKEAEMSVVGIQAADGRRALLAFTGMDSLELWDARARPVPVTLDTAAEATLSDGAAALVIDVAGPDPVVVDGEVLAQLAAGHRLVRLGDGFGWVVASTE